MRRPKSRDIIRQTKPSAQIYGEPGAICWIELITDNVEGSKDFYTKVFGWSTGGTSDYTEFGVGSNTVAGMMPKPEMIAGMPNFWGVYFAVDDADQSVARITELGGSVHMPPTDIEPGRFAVVADSSGAMFNIIQLKARTG